MLGLLPLLIIAQTPVPGTPYTRFQDPIAYTELNGATDVVTMGSSQYVTVSLPFAFRFYDETFTSVVAGNAGCLAFMPSATITTSNQIPGTNTAFGNIDGWIAPFWDSLNMLTAQDAHLAYQVSGAAPNRVVAFEWKNANRSFTTTGMEWFNFQVRLHEGLAGRIEIDYGPQGPTAAQFPSATMAMESPQSDRVVLFAPSNCTASCVLTDYEALTAQRLTLVQDPGVELIANQIDAPQFATLGVETPVSAIVGNLHSTALGPFDVTLSASPTADGLNAVEVARYTLSLAPYQTAGVPLVMNAPLSLGEQSFYLVLQVDAGGAVGEVDESNNRFLSPDQVRFLPSQPDFEVVRVANDRDMVSSGDQVTIYGTVRNPGSQPITGGTVALMLSTNTAITPQDVELSRFSLDLAPRESATSTVTVVIPAGTNTGAYWLGVLADPSNAIDEVSEANNGRAALRDLTVVGGDLAITTVALPIALVGQSYIAIMSAAGGEQAVGWSVSEGMLPPGIGLVAPSGAFFGRPQEQGVFTFTVQATSGSEIASKSLVLTVSDPEEPLTIVSRSLPNAVVGQEFVFELRATGGAATGTLAWSSLGLPDGIMMSEEGVLAGSAIQTGTSSVEVSVTNGLETAARTLLLEVTENANLQIVPTELPTASYGEPYRANVETTGGLPPISFILELGALPQGLELMQDGTIEGTPIEVGRFRLVLQARDSGAPAAIDANTFELVVRDTSGFVIETDSLPRAVVNVGYRATVKAIGGLPPYDWTLEGRLPMGMIAQISEEGEFLIVGTADQAAVTNLLVSVSDAQGRTALRAFALEVSEAMVVPTSGDDEGCGCTSIDQRASSRPGTLLLLALLGMLVVRRRSGARRS